MQTEILSSLALIITPILFAALIFFVRRFIAQSDKTQQTVTEIHESVGGLKIQLGMILREVRNLDALLKEEVRTLKGRDNILHNEIQEIKMRYRQ